MLNFIQYINEVRLYHAGSDEGGIRAHKLGMKFKHDAPAGEKPIWLGHHSKETRKHYYKPAKGRKGSHFSKMKVKGNVAHHRDPNVKKLLYKHGHNIHDYNKMLSYEPHRDDVHNHPITKTLKKHGYVGYTHHDQQAAAPRKPRSRKHYNKELARNIKQHGMKRGKSITGSRDEEEPRDASNTVVFHRKHTKIERTLKK